MEERKIEIVGQYAATLSLIEVALGSLLHALHVPLSGYFLSLNQGFLLCRATLSAQELASPALVPYTISNVAAVLKSLAPAGKKLGPMLSLSMQGLLFSCGPWALGPGLLGLSLGMVLLSLWTFLQPVLTYYLYFGSQLFEAVAYLFEKTVPYHGLKAQTLWWVLGGLVMTKAIIGISLAVIAWRTQGKTTFQDKLVALAEAKGLQAPKQKAGSPFLLALRDLCRPFFLLSLAITGFFLLYAERQGAQTLWLLMRPIAIGFLFFYFSRTLTLERSLQRMEAGRLRGFALACQSALVRLRR